MFQIKVVQKINNFISENRAVYKRMWKKYGRAGQATDDNIIRNIRIACYRTKATDTHRICNTYCFSTATMVTRTRPNVTLYVHCLFSSHVSTSIRSLPFPSKSLLTHHPPTILHILTHKQRQNKPQIK
jgi:hypothetical protein